jgi:hypothetical protein
MCAYYIIILSMDLCNSVAYFITFLGLVIKTTFYMSNSAIQIVPNMKHWHTEVMPEQFNPIHWRTGELPFYCNALWRVVQAAFSHLWFLHPPFCANLKPLSTCAETLAVFHIIFLSSKGRPCSGKEECGLLAYRKSEHPWDAFQNPNRVQNINIPRNLLFPYIICLLKKKDWKKIFNVWLQWQSGCQ